MSKYTIEQIAAMSPAEFRSIVRKGEWTDTNRDACRGYAFAGLVVLPKEYAFDFLLFCLRNPRPLPVLEVMDPGDPCPKLLAPGADLRTDLPRYHVLKDGEVIDETTDIRSYWRDDFVAFLVGCSLGIEAALRKANVRYRFNGVFNTNLPVVPAGRFQGKMAVSCRIFASSYDAVRAIQISSRLPAAHGAPVHVGDPSQIGIKDIGKADYLQAYVSSPPKGAEVILFWGCAVTAERSAVESKLPYMIVQKPGCLFATDKLIDELAII